MVANKRIHLPKSDSLLQISLNKHLEQSTLRLVTSSDQMLKEGGGRRGYGGINGHGGGGN